MTTTTKLERNQEQAREYLDKIVGTPYKWWTSGIVPQRGPAWARNGAPPAPAEVRKEGCFCAGVPTLARRAVGLPVPTLGNENYDGGIVAYFGATNDAASIYPRRGYFDVHGRERGFDLEEARRPWTLVGRKFRDANDQGHVAIVLPNGNVLQSYDDGGGRPGVNADVTLERSHARGYYEVMVRAEDWLLPFDHKDDEGPREEREEARPQQRPRPQQEEKPEKEAVLVTAGQLSEISGNADLKTLEKYREALVPEMRKAGITTPLRMAAFLGNVCQETDRLKTLEEYGGYNYWLYLDRNSGRAGEWRYHGRGFLMNTWKAAYANLSRVLDVDLVSNPDLLKRPALAAKAATWFWKQHNLNAYADRGEFKKVCAIINTGQEWGEPNHLAERLHFYDRAKRVLASAPGAGGKADREALDRKGLNTDGLPYINLAAVGQADETAAFVLAAEIRKAGIGVTVTNGAARVYALAKKMRPERLGYRQLWIMGGPALEACGDYGELANWPVSRKSDYYDLSSKSLTGTCRRAAELADEKVRRGVGQRFLRAMDMAEPDDAGPRLEAPAPRDEADDPPVDREQAKEDGGRHEGVDAKDRNGPGRQDHGKREEREYEVARHERTDGPPERLADEDLEEIGREVLKLVSSIRNPNGRGRASRARAEGQEEED